MRFGYIQAAYLFWLVFALIGFLLWSEIKRRKALERFADKNLLVVLISSFDVRKHRLKIIMIIFSFCLMIFALMRPQWGFKWQKIQRKGLDIMIAVDVSKSMLAEDIKPNRLERVKLALVDFVRHLKGDRIGLIAFAGTAFVQCPLTMDYDGFLLSVKALDVNTIPKPGTSITAAIRQAIESYEGGFKKYKVLIIITDGEDHEGDPLKAAELAKEEGIRIFCIGIGTPEGELIPITDDNGNKIFLKDKTGAVVKTRLDETVLQKIALATGGSYVRSGPKEFGLDLIYNQRLSEMERRELESKMAKQYEERFQLPLLLAFLFLIGEFLMGESKNDKIQA
ncbi:MAG: VWA domain-containing protein [Candidatus Omnitrophica bacterium]|nr:VWA domain-containing protein [Candidatus Omnitrophota bacterium]